MAPWSCRRLPRRLAVHGAAVPVSKPGLPSNWAAVQPLPEPDPTAHVKLAVPLAPVVSVAVTVTLLDPAVVGVPEISPVEELIDRPAGKPEAL